MVIKNGRNILKRNMKEIEYTKWTKKLVYVQLSLAL